MKNNDEELRRLQQRSYEAMIRARELENTLKLMQKSQAPAPTPTPTRRPVGRLASPLEWYSSDARKSEKIFLAWRAGGTREPLCEICVRQTLGETFLNDVLVRGISESKSVGWVSVAGGEQDIRCAICSRRVVSKG
jgi:hypothetical protein